MNRQSLHYPDNKSRGAISMYRNGDNDNKNNGRKRVPLTRMTDMGVEVIDAPSSAERAEDEAKKRSAGIGGTHEAKGKSLLEEDDAPARAELLNVEEKRSTKRRVITAAVVIIGLLVVLTALSYFWLGRSAKNGMSYQVKSNKGRSVSA